MKQMPHDVWREARVALAGPILGSLGAAAVWVAGEALDSELLVALAFTGFFLNLFNLIPVSPLDGGRAVAALHPALWAVGLAMLLGLTIAARTRSSSSCSWSAAWRSGAVGGSVRSPRGREYYAIQPGSGPSSASPTSGSPRCSRSR